jgi:hypothetical protein
MTQQNPSVYAQAIQAQLDITLSIPVYANFNRNFAVEPDFATWQLRNVHQPVYTGQNQNNKGIDTPIFQISVYSQNMQNAFNNSNLILQSLHGYSGLFGGATYGIQIAKADVTWLYNTYDNTVGLHQIILDCQLDIPT